MFGFSVLGYVLQLAKPPEMALSLELRILQYLTHGPWNATPSSCLMSLCDLSFPREPASLAEANIAAMLRAAGASAAYPAAAALVDHQPHDIDALIVPRQLQWIETTAIVQLKTNLSDFSNRFPDFLICPTTNVQYRARMRLRLARPSPWDNLFQKRAYRWFLNEAPMLWKTSIAT